MSTEPSSAVRTASGPVRFSLAANYDPDLVPALAAYPVDEVYGKFPTDGVSGGRPRYMATPLSEADLRGYIDLLDRHGIAFDYLLNGTCFGNREWTRPWQKRVMALLSKLGDLGVRRLTVSTPFLLELVKRRFPEFKVRVGIYAHVNTPRRARFWEELGADGITLESLALNRSFGRLAAIRQAVRCDLQLIANHICLPDCPLQSYHQNGLAHASDGGGTLFIDYCFLRCSRLRLTDPSLFIKSAWIRPEDLAAYEAMGYTTFKILERGIPSAELLRRVKAYSERQFEGNLAELLLPYGFKEPVRKESLWALRHFWKPWQVNPLRLKPLFDLARLQGMLSPLPEGPVRIDSQQIPADFLDGFRARDCASMDCQACGYCARIAAKAVSISPEYRTEVLGKYAEMDKAMVTGGLWGVDPRATPMAPLGRSDSGTALAVGPGLGRGCRDHHADAIRRDEVGHIRRTCFGQTEGRRRSP